MANKHTKAGLDVWRHGKPTAKFDPGPNVSVTDLAVENPRDHWKALRDDCKRISEDKPTHARHREPLGNATRGIGAVLASRHAEPLTITNSESAWSKVVTILSDDHYRKHVSDKSRLALSAIHRACLGVKPPKAERDPKRAAELKREAERVKAEDVA